MDLEDILGRFTCENCSIVSYWDSYLTSQSGIKGGCPSPVALSHIIQSHQHPTLVWHPNSLQSSSHLLGEGFPYLRIVYSKLLNLIKGRTDETLLSAHLLILLRLRHPRSAIGTLQDQPRHPASTQPSSPGRRHQPLIEVSV